MHDFLSFLFPLLGFFSIAAALGFAFTEGRRRSDRHTVAGNLALAVKRSDRSPRHLGPRRNTYRDGNRDGNGAANSDGNSHSDGYRVSLGSV